MIGEIENIGLSRGVWQKLIEDTLRPDINTKVECSYPDSRTSRISIFTSDDKEEIAHFSMSFLHGCKGIVISHEMFVNEKFRGHHIATKLQPIKMKIARDIKASIILATINQNNHIEKKIIKTWSEIFKFKNNRTQNDIQMFIKRVDE